MPSLKRVVTTSEVYFDESPFPGRPAGDQRRGPVSPTPAPQEASPSGVVPSQRVVSVAPRAVAGRPRGLRGEVPVGAFLEGLKEEEAPPLAPLAGPTVVREGHRERPHPQIPVDPSADRLCEHILRRS